MVALWLAHLGGSHISSADAAVLLLAGGAFLLILETLRPGLVLAGVLGLTLVLVGIHRLAALPLRFSAVLLLGAAVLFAVAGARFRLWPLGSFLATVSFALGLLRLVSSAPAVSPTLAIAAAVGLAPLLSTLARVAFLARRGKRHLPPPARLFVATGLD